MVDRIFVDRAQTLLLPFTVGTKFGRPLVSQPVGVSMPVYRHLPDEPHLVEFVEILIEPGVVDRFTVLVFEFLLDDLSVRIAARQAAYWWYFAYVMANQQMSTDQWATPKRLLRLAKVSNAIRQLLVGT